MNRKGALKIEALLIIGILIFLVFFYQPTASIINLSGLSESTTIKESISTSETHYITETEQTNLCELFQPYIVAGDLANQCDALGGYWVCQDDEVGCYDAAPGSIDCDGGVFWTAVYQCQTVGAEAFCDGSNVICQY